MISQRPWLLCFVVNKDMIPQFAREVNSGAADFAGAVQKIAFFSRIDKMPGGGIITLNATHAAVRWAGCMDKKLKEELE